MKKIFLLVFFAVSLTLANAQVSVSTIIFDGTSQPPVVGGYINDFSSGKVLQKGIIVGLSQNNMVINDYEDIEEVTEYRCLCGAETPVKNKRCYDCTKISAEQYSLQLRHLLGDRDYFVRAFVKTSDNKYLYGKIENIHSQNFSRYDGRADYGNVWYAFDHTMFDLVTDEIINYDTDGFYYSTNENPKNCDYQIGDGYNTCYKFLTKWNYELWYCHCGDGDTWQSYDTGMYRPVMTFSDNKLTISKNPSNAQDKVTIYYSINDDGMRPENYTQIYSEPLNITEPCTVYCYAKRKDGNISFTNMYKIFDSYITNNIENVTSTSFVNVYSIGGIIVKTHVPVDKLSETLPTGLYIINGGKYYIKHK